MDRMTETEARELLEYIYNKPSYLFLGQAYQRESLNKNSYLDKLYAEAGCSDSIHSWRNLLEDHSDSIDQIYDTAADLSVSVSVPFLSELVNLPSGSDTSVAGHLYKGTQASPAPVRVL